MEEKRELTPEEMDKVFGGAPRPISEKTIVCPLCRQENILPFDEKPGVCQFCEKDLPKQ